MPRKLPDLTAFGPEIMTALVEGSRREIKMTVSYSSAVQFRLRMHMLRARMRQDSHPLAQLVQAARITIRWPEDTPVSTSSRGVDRPRDPETLCELTIKPQDLDFREALNRAGVSVDDKTVEPVDAPQPQEKVEDILEEFLKTKGAA